MRSRNWQRFCSNWKADLAGAELIRHPGKKQLITGVDLDGFVSLDQPGGILTIRKASYLLLHPVRKMVRELAEKITILPVFIFMNCFMMIWKFM